MATMMETVKKVKRGTLYSADEAGAVLGISGQLVRLWVRMGLMFADKVGKAYIIRAEQLALVSERYHNNYYVDAPVGRDGTLHRVVLE